MCFKKTLVNDVKCFECTLRYVEGANVKLVKLLANDEFLNQLNFHTHPLSQEKVEVTKIKSKIKDRANTSNETPQQILGAELQQASEATIVS